MRLFFKGAEGDLYYTTWNGKKAILKMRKAKKYRNKYLDFKIRKQRTLREAAILSHVKSLGIYAPLVYLVSPLDYTIIIQYISGSRLFDLPDLTLIKHCKDIGRIVGTLHSNSIIHGDLTTSNFILNKDKIFAIDFGLATKTHRSNDHAIDLRIFKEILASSHTRIMEKAWKRFLSGYSSTSTSMDKVLNQLLIIEGRGRYATVV